MNFVVLELDRDLKSLEYVFDTAGNFRAYAVSWEEHHPLFK
jgi:hypothetical protein